jgi:hypothetical protein
MGTKIMGEMAELHDEPMVNPRVLLGGTKPSKINDVET